MFKQVIYYFMAVVEEGSFSKAAKKYYLSQSAISQQITKLEKRFRIFLCLIEKLIVQLLQKKESVIMIWLKINR